MSVGRVNSTHAALDLGWHSYVSLIEYMCEVTQPPASGFALSFPNGGLGTVARPIPLCQQTYYFRMAYIFSFSFLWPISNMLYVLSRPEETIVVFTAAICDRQN